MLQHVYLLVKIGFDTAEYEPAKKLHCINSEKSSMLPILPILLTLVPIYPSIRSVAFKNACGARRAAWRIITSVEEKERAKGNTQNVRPGSPDHA